MAQQSPLCAGASYAIPWKYVWPLQVRHIQWTHVVCALDINSGAGEAGRTARATAVQRKHLLIMHSALNSW